MIHYTAEAERTGTHPNGGDIGHTKGRDHDGMYADNWRRWCLNAEAITEALVRAIDAPPLTDKPDGFAYVLGAPSSDAPSRSVRIGARSDVAAALVHLESGAITYASTAAGAGA